MKRYIYITLFVFASLFSQAFGAQYEPPTFYDTICAEPDAVNLQMSDLETLISIFLYDREDSIWLEYGNTVKVELGDITGQVIENNGLHPFDTLSGEKINATKTIQLDVEYTRKLVFSKIPSTENEAQKTSATLALWHLFGKLLSETDTERVTKISDEASITTLHKATFVYRFELALPENEFKIQGDSCLVDNQIVLSVDSAYLPYTLKWQAEGMEPVEALGSPVRFGSKSDENYFYSVLCTATACKGETRSATFVIGKPTPKPTIDDISCIAANETSFNVAVKEPDSRLSYYWSVENFGNGRIIDTQQGVSVIMAIPQKETVRLKLRSTGGCKDAEMEPMILHRSLVSEAHHIEMEAEPHCIFAGDTLRLSLSETPEDTLVWQIAGNTTMLPPHDTYNYPTVQEKENVIVSVYTKVCPNNIITDTFNIREDFRVSLGTSPMCISANEYQVIKLTSNGINPEVHWYGNGVEIDSSTYKKEDSIRLKLTNSGDQNLYVKVMAKECGRERDTLLVLHPKPETPSLDPLLGMLTPCIPLGMVDTIELRVQPQDGVKFKWEFSDNEKFRRIAESDSHSISVATNFGLLDSEEDKTIKVNIYAYTEGCPDTLDKQETLYAAGAGLDEEWNVIQQIEIDEEFDEIWGYTIGFSNDGLVVKDYGTIDPFNGRYLFDWYAENFWFDNTTMPGYYFFGEEVDEAFDIFCKLTSKENQCYSIYSTTVGDIDMFKLQSVVPKLRLDAKTGEKNDSETTSEECLRKKEDTPCPGIVLHPNPVRSGVQVKVEGLCETESFTVECYSPQGRLMFRTTAKGDTFTLPTDNYAAGVYIVKIQLNGAAAPVVKKLIIL